jgi:hypothetical protein
MCGGQDPLDDVVFDVVGAEATDVAALGDDVVDRLAASVVVAPPPWVGATLGRA